MEIKRVLVTGATGFLGSRIVESLCEDSNMEKIIGSGRILKSHNHVKSDKLTYLLGDLTNRLYVDQLLEDVDAIVHCAALSSPWGSYEAFWQSNVLTQKHLIESGIKNGIKRFVYISTPSIYFNGSDRKDIKEKDSLPKKLINHYAATKLAAERMLEESELSFVTLRPRAIIGRGDSVIMPRLIRAYNEGRLRIIGDGNNVVDLTSVSNVVHAVKLALKVEDQHCNKAYNITDGQPVNLWHSIATVLELLNMQPPKRKIPRSIALAVARLMETKSIWFDHGKEPILTKYTVGTMACSLTMNIESARASLGYVPICTTEQSIHEFASWYKSIKDEA